MIYEMIENTCEGENILHITLDITYAELDNSVEIKFSCAGKEYNPLEKNFEDFDEENLGATILHNLAQNFSHEYTDGVNEISFRLA